MPWYDRECSGGCGRKLAARTNDPAVRVMCTVCDPGNLPLSPPPDLVTWLRAEIHGDHDRARDLLDRRGALVRHEMHDAIADAEAKVAILDGHATEIIPGGALPTHYWCQTCHVPGDNPGRTWCRTVRLLASGYQHRPGYRAEEWKP